MSCRASLALVTLKLRSCADGHMSSTAILARALKPCGGMRISTGRSSAKAVRKQFAPSSSHHEPTRNRPVPQSAAQIPIHAPSSSPSSTMEHTNAASGHELSMPVSTIVPLVKTCTISRRTTVSLHVLSFFLRSASCAGVSVCSMHTTRWPLRANCSACIA